VANGGAALATMSLAEADFVTHLSLVTGRHTSSSGECKRVALLVRDGSNSVHEAARLSDPARPATARQWFARSSPHGRGPQDRPDRLRIYFLARRQLTVTGKPFVAGTSYKDIIRLYECDALMREVCFATVGQFEILFRKSISEALSNSHGSHPYLTAAAFKDPASHVRAIRSFADVHDKSKDDRASTTETLTATRISRRSGP
jgi:hypothetical protein